MAAREHLVVRHPVSVQDNKYYNLHRLLRAIDKNTLLSKLLQQAHCQPDETFRSPAELLNLFRQYPFIVTNTYKAMLVPKNSVSNEMYWFVP